MPPPYWDAGITDRPLRDRTGPCQEVVAIARELRPGDRVVDNLTPCRIVHGWRSVDILGGNHVEEVSPADSSLTSPQSMISVHDDLATGSADS